MTEFQTLRRECGISVEKIASILGVSKRAVESWEQEPTRQSARDVPPTAIRVMRWIKSGALDLARVPED